jgi:hypothetical protein
MRTKRQYSDAEKGEALATLDANKGNVRLTARICRVPEKTLADWRDGKGTPNAVADLRDVKKSDLADRFEEIVHQLLGAMPGKIEEATLLQCATTVGIAVDKMILLRSQSTPAPALTDEERFRRVEQILAQARARREAEGQVS